jgi:CheY-like chemotaxis protein
MLEAPHPPRSSPLSSFAVSRRTASPRKVLVVEDNIDAVRTLSALISEMGHFVSYAINGYAALEIGRRMQPEFVLLDIGLPAMNGLDLCQRMKQDAAFAASRMIALTAYGDEFHRQRSREAGCELHLVKPVPAQTIFDVLESRLAGARR